MNGNGKGDTYKFKKILDIDKIFFCQYPFIANDIYAEARRLAAVGPVWAPLSRTKMTIFRPIFKIFF